MVLVQFQDVTPGGCLGLARPRGLESPATKSLAEETGLAVGEIDLAWQLIAEWQPRPLASLALPEETLSQGDLRYRVALLTVLFHELEHLAFPDRPERDVRGRSDALYETVLRATAQETGNIYGIAGKE